MISLPILSEYNIFNQDFKTIPSPSKQPIQFNTNSFASITEPNKEHSAEKRCREGFMNPVLSTSEVRLLITSPRETRKPTLHMHLSATSVKI